MKWITRERPKIDRIACPWLIKRFVDKDDHEQLDIGMKLYDALYSWAKYAKDEIHTWNNK